MYDIELVFGAQARVGTIVYGAPNHLLGGDGSWVCAQHNLVFLIYTSINHNNMRMPAPMIVLHI
jgi:hypothetical protein